MSYIDAHLHLAEPEYRDHVEEAVNDANRYNVAFLLSNAMDYQTSIQTITLARRYPAKVLAAIGVHPWTVTSSTDYRLDQFQLLVEENLDEVKAIGEIGLDGKYTQDQALKSRQREVFRFFLALAERNGLPVVVHSRQAVDEVFEELTKFNLPNVLLHWYDGPAEKLRLAEDRGYFVSIGPAVFYAGKIGEIARNAKLDTILTETDTPVKYRAPFQDRLTRPSFVIEVVRRVAEIRGISIEAMREAVFRNFNRLLPSL